MGASIQWRQPPPGLKNRRYGTTVSFGRGRSEGRGYMAASSRVGPSVLVVDDDVDADGGPAHLFADALNEAGFTALSIDVAAMEGGDPLPVLEAGASFLAENWHPRLGIVAFGPRVPESAQIALEVHAEALVAYVADPAPQWDSGELPVMVHVWGADAGLSRDPGVDAEVYFYGEDVQSEDGDNAALAFERTLDFFLYHLS
jgi:hypothetical protein